MATAISIGMEWLGSDHPAVQCLRLGVGLHHGRLPRTFLRELEALVNLGVIRLVIASPTIAQGLNLSCSAMVLHTLRRGREDLTLGEFRNVVGRVGRAFVDLDGIVVLPLRGLDRVERNRKALFDRLRAPGEASELLSGLLLLVHTVIAELSRLLGNAPHDLAEYVLNHAGRWGRVEELSVSDPQAAVQDETYTELDKVLDDLDVAILGTVEDPATDAAQLAAALDSALAGSLWERQIYNTGHSQELFRQTLLGRAQWLWARTDAGSRRGFYWAGVGAESGERLTSHLSTLVDSLLSCEDALLSGEIDLASSIISGFAGVVFSIHPFAPSSLPTEWERLLADWLQGRPAGQSVSTSDSDEAAFVQDGIVYRLVWALEAVRSLALATGIPAAQGLSSLTAMCLTFGVPSREAAYLILAGLRSRSLALRLLREFPHQFSNRSDVEGWLAGVKGNERLPEVLADDNDRRIWEDFETRRNSERSYPWVETATEVDDIDWLAGPPAMGTWLRVDTEIEAGILTLRRPDFAPVGRTSLARVTLSAGTAIAQVSGRNGATIRTFGPA